MPVLKVNNVTSYTLDVSTTDNNTASTQYMISVNAGVKYVAPDGSLSASPVWILLNNKKITVKGLDPSTTYSFQAKAKNGDNIVTNVNLVSGTTLIPPPAAPTNLIATATSDQITVSWDRVQNATEGYDIMADGDIINNGTSTTYTHTSLSPGTPHTYQVRAKMRWAPATGVHRSQNLRDQRNRISRAT